MHSCTYAIKEQKYYTSGVGIIHLDRVNPIYMEFLVTSNSTPLRAPNASQYKQDHSHSHRQLTQ
jgi:hypothetical protein